MHAFCERQVVRYNLICEWSIEMTNWFCCFELKWLASQIGHQMFGCKCFLCLRDQSQFSVRKMACLSFVQQIEFSSLQKPAFRFKIYSQFHFQLLVFSMTTIIQINLSLIFGTRCDFIRFVQIACIRIAKLSYCWSIICNGRFENCECNSKFSLKICAKNCMRVIRAQS